MSKTLILEANGIVYMIARQREIKVVVTDTATWRQVIAALAQAAPALVGEVISKDRRSLLGDFMFNVEGDQTITDLDGALRDLPETTRLVLLSDLC
ncbi:MAG: hypothetical protein RBT75_21135 [Anaerolineae bacterium]|jgi:hypothetical protein|nr:hypothetical protein [Anaerolineae bacterium]